MLASLLPNMQAAATGFPIVVVRTINCVVMNNINPFINATQMWKSKSNFICRDKVASTFSKKMFDCVVPNGTTSVDCNSPNKIYLISK